jgi:hypothetical protein
MAVLIMDSSILRRFQLFVIAALLITITGCSGKSGVRNSQNESTAFDDLRDQVRASISEQGRQHDALAIVEKFETGLSSLLRNREQREIQFLTLYANYDAPRTEIDAFLRETEQLIQRDQKHILRQRNDLIALTTADEWALIANAREDVMSHAFESIQSK